jgi:hypothetical protein
MAITVISGIGIKFGDDEVFELQRDLGDLKDFEYIELNTIKHLSGTNIDNYSDQSNADFLGFTIPKRGVWSTTIDLIYDNELLAHQYLYDTGQGLEDFEEVLQLQITKPNTGVITKNVSIETTINATTGNDIRLTIAFREVE